MRLSSPSADITLYFPKTQKPQRFLGFSYRDDMLRELSPKGWGGQKARHKIFSTKHIDIVLSSPLKRAVDTIQDFAQSRDLQKETVTVFRERKIDNEWGSDYDSFSKAQNEAPFVRQSEERLNPQEQKAPGG